MSRKRRYRFCKTLGRKKALREMYAAGFVLSCAALVFLGGALLI